MEKELEEIVTAEEDIDKNDTENSNKEESREFYVYKHIRKDNNTCCYVGKGKGRRIYNPKRNSHYNRIRKKYGCYVVKIKENLTEKEAFVLEREIIEDYVFVFGYGINIDGYRDYDHEYLTNCTWGGEGTSGMNPFAGKTEEEMEEIGKKISESEKGKKMSEEAKQKISEAKKGEKNPMFGKNAYENKTKEEMEEISKKISEKVSGEKNPMAKKVICITTGKIFDCIKDAGYHYGISPDTISTCCKGKRKSSGVLNHVPLQWKYLKDYNNEFKGILINPIAK